MPLVAEEGQIKKPTRERRASALARCLTWPQVALNRHGLQLCPFTIVVRRTGVCNCGLRPTADCTANCGRTADWPTADVLRTANSGEVSVGPGPQSAGLRSPHSEVRPQFAVKSSVHGCPQLIRSKLGFLIWRIRQTSSCCPRSRVKRLHERNKPVSLERKNQICQSRSLESRRQLRTFGMRRPVDDQRSARSKGESAAESGI